MAQGLVYALDIGVRSGFAYGRPGEKPTSGAMILKKPSEHRAVAFANFIATLNDHFTQFRPALVAKERWWGLGASANANGRGNSETVVYLHVGLHSIVEGLCGRHGIPWREAADSTIRKHFIGKGRMGDRDATKAAVVERCHLLGLMPRDKDDNNRADAIAVHDWACATFANRSISTTTLYMFGEAGHG
jgi:Holliday junction resolvasome RuvABC endonuclease subunit